LYSASVSETVDLLLRGARLPDRQSLADIAITGDRIVAVDPVARPAQQTLELGGRLVTPGLVEAHIHLDKALLTDRVTVSAGTLDEALRVTAQAKRTFTAEDITSRARQVLDLAVRAGTTAMRTYVEVDPIVGLMGMEAMLALRQEYAPALDLQLCAFAQEGIVKAPGTEGLLRRALTMGADLVGGCPYNDTDGVEHIRIVFGLATAFGVDADFHVDFADEPEHLHVREIAAQTVRAGWQGRVSVGHLTELGIPSSKEQVSLQLQFALPFANVVVILLGIPFAYRSLQKGNVQSIAYACGATFLYWGTVSVFQSYGEQGFFPAWVSAWTPNFIFGIMAVWLLQRTTKI